MKESIIMFSICPQCRKSMIVTAIECPTCSTKIQGKFRLPFLTDISEGQIKTLLALIAARGKINRVGELMGTNRNSAAGMLANLRFDMIHKATLIENESPEASLFLDMCKRIDNNTEQDK